MMNAPGEDYEGISIRAVPLPIADRIGEWWRRRWTFTIQGGGGFFRLPPPPRELTAFAAVVCCWWESDEGMILELHTANEELSGEELTYISVVAAWLEVCFPDKEVLVDGLREHPLLRMSRISDDLARILLDEGYGPAD